MDYLKEIIQGYIEACLTAAVFIFIVLAAIGAIVLLVKP